jgi:hypothetical protein
MIWLTTREIDALITCVECWPDAEWPFEEINLAVAKRAVRKLRDLSPREGVLRSLEDQKIEVVEPPEED